MRLIHTKVGRVFGFVPFLSAALSLARCFTENIGQPGGRGGVARAGLDEKGAKVV